MLRKISFALLCATATFAANTYSSVESITAPKDITIEYDLYPHDPQVLTNYMFWAVEAVCKITTEDESNDLLAEALAKKGKVNDTVLTKGQSLRLAVHAGDLLRISADSGAQVRITNEGQHKIKATCTSV